LTAPYLITAVLILLATNVYSAIITTIQYNPLEVSMLRRLFLILITLFCSFCFADIPLLSSKDVTIKTQEILKGHVTYKSLNSNLIERALRNFIDELDPSKTYFIESDIQSWLYPTEDLKEKFLEGYKNSDFTGFETIYEEILTAINRRNQIEKEIETATLPQVVDHKELMNLNWSSSKEDLTNRILKIKALQLKTAEKFNDGNKDQFLKILEKRRVHREAEIIGETPEAKKGMILSLILKATACALDAHTNYFTPNEAKQFMIQVQQRLFGIGALLKDNLTGLSISRILEGSPAEKSKKLKIGDLIIAVDNKPVIGMDIADAVDLIRGEKGSKVLLTLLRDNDEHQQEKLDIEIKRGEVVLEESRIESSFESFADGIIAHIKLFSFYQDPKSSSAQDLKNVLEKLQKEHKVKGVILDLRNNSGGLLPQAVSVTGLFITKGIIASIKDSSGHIQHLRDTEGKTVWDGPLIVLTNRASASAAEIVAQTLQDYGRAIVVGDVKTFGKGSFQTFTLDNSSSPKVNPQGEYKVTRGMYYTVSGKSPQLVGVKADIVVPGVLSQMDVGEEFSKYPLEGDQISPHFEDDLSDIPPLYRKKVSLLYKHNLQTILTQYTQYLDGLKENSHQRIENNKSYKNFLKEINNKNFDLLSGDMYCQTDLQLFETFNIMKDLIYFIEVGDKQAACF
jgi:carboxyl-terminal processing protease